MRFKDFRYYICKIKKISQNSGRVNNERNAKKQKKFAKQKRKESTEINEEETEISGATYNTDLLSIN